MDVVGVGRVGRWLAQTKILRKRQRAFASESALRRWTAGRAMRLREIPCLTPGGVRPLPPDTLPPAASAPVRPRTHTHPVLDGPLRNGSAPAARGQHRDVASGGSPTGVGRIRVCPGIPLWVSL